MKRVYFFLQYAISIGLVFTFLASCGQQKAANQELSLTVNPGSVSMLPFDAFSCQDISSGSTTKSIKMNTFQFANLKLKWNVTNHNGVISYIHITGTNETLDAPIDCIISDYELAYMAYGLDPATAGNPSTVTMSPGQELTLPHPNAPCKPTCGNVSFKKGVTARAVQLQVEVLGIDDSASPKSFHSYGYSVLSP